METDRPERTILRESPTGAVMLTTEAVVSGEGFDPLYGETRVQLTIGVSYRPTFPRDVFSFHGVDLITGGVWTDTELRTLSDDKGRAALDKAIADACERFEATGRMGDDE